MVLDEGSLWYLLNDLYDVRKKWKLIGLGLGFPASELEVISGSHLDCLRCMLEEWLKKINPCPTLDSLVAVLRSRVVGEEKKALEFQERFCYGAPASPSSTLSGSVSNFSSFGVLF